MTYDPQNIFAKILRNEIPCNKVFENEFAFAFHDIAPQAAVHILVIPKGPFVSFDDFTRKAPPALQQGFFAAIQSIAEQESIVKSGYRLICNHGADSNQEVPHFHMHILAGENLGALLPKAM